MNFKRLLAESIIWRGLYFFSVLLVNVFLSRYLRAAGSGNLYFITIIFSFITNLLLTLVNFIFININSGKDVATTPSETQNIILLYFFSFVLSGILLLFAFFITNKKEGSVGFPVKKEVKQILKYSLTALA